MKRKEDVIFSNNMDERIENRDFCGRAMVEPDHDVALEDTDRIHGRTALVNNVRAATSLAGAIRSTLGPKGLDKPRKFACDRHFLPHRLESSGFGKPHPAPTSTDQLI